MNISSSTIILIILSINSRSNAQLPPQNRHYKIVFHDEFDKKYKNDEPLDPAKWARSAPWNQSSNKTNASWCFQGDTIAGNWDRAYEVKDLKDTTTIKISNGTCKILTNKATYDGQVSNWPECDPDKPGYAKNGSKCADSCYVRGHDNIPRCWVKDILPFKYTTTQLFSRQKYFQGYFEIRFRLPEAPEAPYTHEGFGPAFWLYGNKPPINYWSEIDVFEIFAFNPQKKDTNMYTSAVHFSDKPSPTGKTPTAFTPAIGNKLKNDTSWHTAAVWWTDEFVKFYLDDSLYFSVQDVKDIPVNKLEEMNIIVGIASPSASRCNNFDPVHTKFPYVFEVDYIRVYQKK